MKCIACSKENLKRETVYTEDKTPYCHNASTCNEQHPNSVENILARQGAVKLYSEEELDSVIFENLNVSSDMKNRIIKVATKPQSIRLSKIDIAHYLVNLQETMGMSSLSEAIRYCVTIAMQKERQQEQLTEYKEEVQDKHAAFHDYVEQKKEVETPSKEKETQPEESTTFTF